MRYFWLVIWGMISLYCQQAFGQNEKWEVLKFADIFEFSLPDDYVFKTSGKITTYRAESDFHVLTASQVEVENITVLSEYTLNKLYDGHAEGIKKALNLDSISQEKTEIKGLIARKINAVKKFEDGSDQIFKALVLCVDNKLFTFSSMLFEDENELNKQKKFFSKVKCLVKDGQYSQYNIALNNEDKYRALGKLFGFAVMLSIGLLIYFRSKRKKHFQP
ncbi:MAG: hypothetical protein GC192_14830 [Bacteroidetes bacterium]|nr:hypothetical protein [Bacteroidota bacterium]